MLKSDRLKQIASHVREHVPMADIGTDHALLPCFLVVNGTVPKAIAVEVNRGPFEAAVRHVKECGLTERIKVRLADGLKGLKPGEVDTIVIAGMGGKLIEHILSDGREVVAETKRLVLQPNVAAEKLRRWMLQAGWQLIDEELVFENDHFYDILVAEQGSPQIPYSLTDGTIREERLIETGPLLWQKKHPLLRAKLKSEAAKWEKILREITISQSDGLEEKRTQIEQRLRDWKEMMACLPKESTSFASLRNGFHRI